MNFKIIVGIGRGRHLKGKAPLIDAVAQKRKVQLDVLFENAFERCLVARAALNGEPCHVIAVARRRARVRLACGNGYSIRRRDKTRRRDFFRARLQRITKREQPCGKEYSRKNSTPNSHSSLCNNSHKTPHHVFSEKYHSPCLKKYSTSIVKLRYAIKTEIWIIVALFLYFSHSALRSRRTLLFYL